MSETSPMARFVTEAREHLGVMGEAMIALEKKPADRTGCVERLLRATHSLKGGAGFVGRKKIEELAHALESVVERVREGEVAVDGEVIDTLLFAFDRIAALVDDVEGSDGAEIGKPLGRLAALMGAGKVEQAVVKRGAAVVEAGEFAMTPKVIATALESGASLYGVKLDWAACEKELGMGPVEVAKRLEGVGVVLDSHLELRERPLKEGAPAGPFWYRCIISSGLKAEEFTRRLGIAIAGISRLEKLANERVEGVKVEARGAVPPTPAPTSLRVSVGLIDKMMELAGELVLVRNQALRTASPGDGGMRRILRRLDNVTSEMHGAALRMRMQPVATLFDRFPRLVRDLARQLNKQIELEISGAEVELDKTVIELLADPLTHLVRNCCDHGIEMPEKRVAAGKSAGGKIQLRASQDRGQILIEVRDDGKGIDQGAVKRKAQENGVKTKEELDRMTPRQVCDLILTSGFSTAAAVTDLSGRGVGMDVVKTNLEQIGGVVEIESTQGRGTLFSMRLPLTLAIMPCLLIRSGEGRFAVPQRDVEEILLVGNEGGNGKVKVECSHEEEVLRLRDVLLPAVRLDELLERPSAFTGRTWAEIIEKHHGAGARPQAGYAAVMRAGSRRFAVLFDEVLENEDIVVKPLHGMLRPLGVYSGSTILGDGGVAMILSAEGVARHSGVLQRAMATAVPVLPEAEEEAETLGVLLTRYGGETLLGIPLGAVRRVIMVPAKKIERTGDRELVNTDGVTYNVLRLEAFLNVTPAESPWVFLVIPRREGTPLAIAVNEIVDTEVIAGALDQQAYMADGVMGTALVRGQIALVLDVAELAHMWEQGMGRKSLPPYRGEDGKKRVLVVEDTQFFQKLVGNTLREAGYDVTVAGNGQEGLEALQGMGFDLVVSDIEMPVMDGWTFAKRVRADGRYEGLRMVALSTLGSPEDRKRSMEAGFNRHEVKFEPESFLKAVRAMTGEKLLTGPGGGA